MGKSRQAVREMPMTPDQDAADQTTAAANSDGSPEYPKQPIFRIRVVLLAVVIAWIVLDSLTTASCTGALLFGSQTRSREMARRIACMSHVKQLTELLRKYAKTNSLEGKTFSDIVVEVSELRNDPRLLQCPGNSEFQYAFDAIGLTDPDRPIVFEAPGTHRAVKSWSLFGRSLPAAHCESRIVDGKILVQFITEE